MSTLITGISGFVGSYLLNDIKKNTEETYFLLLRDRSFELLEKELSEYPHLIPVRGYLHHPDLFTETENWKRCKNEVETVIHLAALYDLGAAKESLYLANVVGTQNVLFFCSQIKNLKNLVYASTIAVAGDLEGPFSENDFDLGQNFGNSYAKTKFEAEGLVRKWASENSKIQTDVLRYGIIVGDSQTGQFQKEDGPYFFFKNVNKVMERLPKQMRFPYIPFPFKGNALFPIIPVDFAALACSEVIKHKHDGLKTYHVISSDCPQLSVFLEDYLSELGFEMNVVSLPESGLVKKGLRKILPILQIPQEMVDYMYLPTLFRTKEWNKLMDIQLPKYENYKSIIFKKAIEVYQPLSQWGNHWERKSKGHK